MILYRYLRAEGAISTLKKSSLKVSKLSEVNDPFELAWRVVPPAREDAGRYIDSRRDSKIFEQYAASVGISYKELDKILNDRERGIDNLLENYEKMNNALLKERLSNFDTNLGILCFSSEEMTTEDDVQMWSHYGVKHTGIRLGFEFSSELIAAMVKMDYLADLPEFNLLSTDEREHIIDRVMKSKKASWSYENEYRLYVPISCCDLWSIFGTFMNFYWFPPSCLISVDVGHKCDMLGEAKEICNLRYPHVLFRKVDFNHGMHTLEYKSI